MQLMSGPAIWLPALPGSIGDDTAVTLSPEGGAIFFQPGLLGMVSNPIAFWKAWRNQGQGPGAPFTYTLFAPADFPMEPQYLHYNGCFIVSTTPELWPGQVAEDCNPYEWTDDPGQYTLIPEANGRPAILASRNAKTLQLEALWIRLPDDFLLMEDAPLTSPLPGENTLVQLTTANAALLDAAMEGLAALNAVFAESLHDQTMAFLEYPALPPMRAQADGAMTLALEFGTKMGVSLRMEGVAESAVLQAVADAGLGDSAVPQDAGGWNGLALPPAWFAPAPHVAWNDTAAMASSGGLESTPAITERIEAHADALLRIREDSFNYYHFSGSGKPPWGTGPVLELVGQVREFPAQSIPHGPRWLAFTRPDAVGSPPPFVLSHKQPFGASPETTAADQLELIELNAIAQHALENQCAIEVPRAEGMHTGLWPHEAYEVCHPWIQQGRAQDAAAVWQQSTLDRVTRSGEPGAVYAPAAPHVRGFQSAAPFVTQTAWSILTTAEIYGALPAEDAAGFHNRYTDDMQAWADFLLLWKRGPDAAPLACIEESAGPGDLYPLLTVWLGLQAASAWLHPDPATLPQEWASHASELRTEISARLLQPGQCLTASDMLLPLADTLGGLSPPALSALGRLPECPQSQPAPQGQRP